ncbi:DNA gyrase inhibitor [Salmonella enterica subsp. enterica serovar Choleraesuis]|nr:DNA gyrase inhibitor [Salmonella enterica subsp. enterica serovar Choleraesuis]
MQFSLQNQPEITIAGFHLTGPWDKTVRQGFEQLGLWLELQTFTQPRWLCAYYGNPQQMKPEQLRCITAIEVGEDYRLPENSAGMQVSRLASGPCAVAVIEVIDNNFTQPWLDFFAALLAEPGHRPDAQRPCLEYYLECDEAAGRWLIEMWIPLKA